MLPLKATQIESLTELKLSAGKMPIFTYGVHFEKVSSNPSVTPWQLLTLFFVWSSSIKTSNWQFLCEILEVLGYLNGQFPGWNKNQHLKEEKNRQKCSCVGRRGRRKEFTSCQTACTPIFILHLLQRCPQHPRNINIPCHKEPQSQQEGNKGKCYKVAKTTVIFFLMFKSGKRHISNITKGKEGAAQL